VLSKNTLKKGYVRPAQKVDPRMLVDLGVPPEQFLPEVARVPEPGGIFAIYNICRRRARTATSPGPTASRPSRRRSSPRPGFELLAFDVDDTPQVHELAYRAEVGRAGHADRGRHLRLVHGGAEARRLTP
jgi:hypothetical protein